MSENEHETSNEPTEPDTGELQEEQRGKGYGDDEGERDEALEQRNLENL